MKLFNKVFYLLNQMKIEARISFEKRSGIFARWVSPNGCAFGYSNLNERYLFCKTDYGSEDEDLLNKFKNQLSIFSYIHQITLANATPMYWNPIHKEDLNEILY